MSQIPSFYLIRNVQKKELSDGGCSGGVYTAIWDWCEDELFRVGATFLSLADYKETTREYGFFESFPAGVQLSTD